MRAFFVRKLKRIEFIFLLALSNPSTEQENRQIGENIIMQPVVLHTESRKNPERSMLMAESEIKRPRGHSSGKVQSSKFGHLLNNP